MIITDMFFWWYTHGWKVFIEKIKNSLINITDFFSMDSLLRTLFKPYRQISAVTAGDTASIDRRFQMFIDRLISRIVGFFSRLVLLITGLILIIIGGVISLALIILWPIIPIMPIAGIVLAIIGATI